MFKIGLENRDFCKSLHFYIVDAEKKKKKKKNELHLLACSAALGPSGRGHRPSGDALTICFSCAAGACQRPDLTKNPIDRLAFLSGAKRFFLLYLYHNTHSQP